MHRDILNQDQIELLPLLKEFKRTFYLVGGTAIALQIGHRRSIDFDLFRYETINHKLILDKIYKLNYKPQITRRVTEQLNLVINDVKFTFFQYPFKIDKTIDFEGYIKMPSLLDLAAMKSYALGRRSKWKDYVDLYFIIQDYHSIKQISEKAKEIYGDLFSEKQFRAQLSFFDDIDFTEEVEYLKNSVTVQEVKDFFIASSTEF